jgi:hypothetical protein
MEEETGSLVAAAKRLDRDLFLLESNTAPALTRYGGALGDVRDKPPPTTIEGLQHVTDALADALTRVR